MRILTITNMYPTEADPTFGTFVADQVAALRAHPRVERCDVLFVDGRASRWNYLRAFAGLHRALRRRPADVVYAHYGLTGAIATMQRRVPTVVTYHTGDLELTRWQREVSGIAYRLAADNICVSLHAMDRLPGPAHHLTCGVDTELFSPRDRASARAAYGIGSRELALLFPSSPDRPKKAYPRFVAVVEELRSRGHLVRELHLRALRREEVPSIMAAADVMVMTSLQEGAPVAVMEALACGLGVVATPVGDVASMLGAARNARVLQFSAAAFADAVEAVAAADDGDRDADPESLRFAESEITDRLVAILEGARASRRSAGAGVVCA
jgi:glycosyltransferase involved in cell wall biosynthesis